MTKPGDAVLFARQTSIFAATLSQSSCNSPSGADSPALMPLLVACPIAGPVADESAAAGMQARGQSTRPVAESVDDMNLKLLYYCRQ